MGLFGMLFTLVVLILCALDVLLFFIPSPIDPKPMSLPKNLPVLEGVLEVNDNLTRAKRLFDGQLTGPESIAVDSTGGIYTGLADGRIVKLEGDKIIDIVQTGKPPCGSLEQEPTCGRPLGLRFDKYGINLIVADAYFGLLEVNPKARTVSTLVPSSPGINGKPFRLVNDLDIAHDGTIYFTDSSTKWERRNYPYAILEGDNTGRLLSYHPKTGSMEVLIEGLNFANGVQISPEGDHILVVETTTCRILKYYIKGEHEGKKEVFAQNLPGMPDNIRLSSQGGYWVGMAPTSLRTAPFSKNDLLIQYPRARNFLAKVFPLEWITSLGALQPHGLLLELNDQGHIVQSLHDPTGKVIPGVSEVHDDGGILYLGSFNGPYIGMLELDS